MRFLSILLVCCTWLAITTTGWGQTLVATGVETSSYPRMQATVYGFSASGALEQLSGSDVVVTDDGAAVGGLSATPAPGTARTASIMIAVDASNSMRLGTPSSFSIAQAGARAGIALPMTITDDIGLMSFDDEPFLEVGLTSDQTSVLSGVANLTLGNGTSIDNGLDSIPMGALAQTVGGRNPRALIVITDATTVRDVARLRARLQNFRVSVYIVGLRQPLSPALRSLAEATGGLWFDGVTSTADAEAYVRTCVAHARNLPATRLSWTAPTSCATTRTIAFQRGTAIRSIATPAPAGSRAVLEASTTSLYFGGVAPSTSRDISVTLTARNRAVTITGVTVAPGFTVSITTPLTLDVDQSYVLPVRYTAADSNARYAELAIASDACDDVVLYARAGFPNRPQQLRLVAPNGGETYTAGTDTVIRWTGVLPTDPVRLDVSTDNGTSWISLSEGATGQSFPWVPGPDIGQRCLVRVQQTVFDPSRVVELSGHSSAVYSAAFTHDGSSVVTGSHDQTARIWNASTGALRHELRGHRDWVTVVAPHPTQPIVATGGYDGDVRIWNTETGALLTTFRFERRVYSLSYMRNDSKLIVGQERALAIIDIATLRVDSNHTDAGMPNTFYGLVGSRDGSRIYCAEGSVATIRDASTFGVLTTFTGHTSGVTDLDLSTNGRTLVTSGSDGTIRTWNVSDGTPIAVSPATPGAYLSVEFGPNDATILTANSDGVVRFHETATLRPSNALAGHRGFVFDARYNKNQSRVVSASTDFTARIWDVNDLRRTEDVSDASFAITGSTVAPSDRNLGTVRLPEAIDVMTEFFTNTSSGPIIVRSIAVTGGDTEAFTIAPLPQPVVVAVGEAFSGEILFAPVRVGENAATVSLETGTGIKTMTVRGTGVPQPFVAPRIVDYRRVVAGAGDRDTTITLRIPSDGQAVSVRGLSITGSSSAQFSILSPTTAFTINPGGSVDLRIRYAATIAGRFAGRVVFDLDGVDDAVMYLYGEAGGNAQVQTSSGIVYNTNPCRFDSINEQLRITNTGSTPLTVYDIIVQGTAAPEFAIFGSDGLPLTFPLQIVAGQSLTALARFQPLTGGIKTAMVVVVTDALNAPGGNSFIQLVARQDSVRFELSRPAADFGNINEGATATTTLSLINTSSVPLRWARPSQAIGPFRILSITPEITPAGGQSIVTIAFTGGVAGTSYSESYTFIDSVCGRSVVMPMLASVKSYIGFVIQTDTVVTTTGTTVSVPVYATQRTRLDRTAVRSIEMDIDVNGTLLTPTSTDAGALLGDGVTRRFTVTATIPDGADSLLTTLQFRTTWGTDSLSAIRVAEVRVADTLQIGSRDGAVVLSDLCREGGVRLFRRTGSPINVQIAPQPAHGSVLINLGVSERGQTKLELADLSGRVVRTVVDQPLVPGNYAIPFDATTLPSGVYYWLLTTPSDRRSIRFDLAQ